MSPIGVLAICRKNSSNVFPGLFHGVKVVKVRLLHNDIRPVKVCVDDSAAEIPHEGEYNDLIKGQ